VMTVASVAGGLSGQRAALGFGVRRVAMVGATLLVVGCLLLTQVSAAGSVGLLLVGQLIFGVGMGATFVCAQIAALSATTEADSGLAAGVVDTSFSMGTALGIAICTSVAAAGSAARVDGHRAAFGTAGLLALLGLAAAAWLLPRDSAQSPRGSAERDTEPTAPTCR